MERKQLQRHTIGRHLMSPLPHQRQDEWGLRRVASQAPGMFFCYISILPFLPFNNNDGTQRGSKQRDATSAVVGVGVDLANLSFVFLFITLLFVLNYTVTVSILWVISCKCLMFQ